MAQRIAFLIGNETFRADSLLEPLKGPGNDVISLARLCGDADLGGFEVRTYINKTRQDILPEIAHCLDSAEAGDMILIFYSGHGKLDRLGRLCLATADTQHSALGATSIAARDLRDMVEGSLSSQVVLMLDCCYSGAAGDLRGDPASELQSVQAASGFYILTACTNMQPAREIVVEKDNSVMGRFTAAIVEGIETGAADPEHTGEIRFHSLRKHLERVVVGQTPQMFASRGNGDPLISRCKASVGKHVDPAAIADLTDDAWHRRLGAVTLLARLISNGSLVEARQAIHFLKARLPDEWDMRVRPQIEQILREVDQNEQTKISLEQKKSELAPDIIESNTKKWYNLLLFDFCSSTIISIIGSLILSAMGSLTTNTTGKMQYLLSAMLAFSIINFILLKLNALCDIVFIKLRYKFCFIGIITFLTLQIFLGSRYLFNSGDGFLSTLMALSSVPCSLLVWNGVSKWTVDWEKKTSNFHNLKERRFFFICLGSVFSASVPLVVKKSIESGVFGSVVSISSDRMQEYGIASCASSVIIVLFSFHYYIRWLYDNKIQAEREALLF